ncbi:MAG: class I SAM-dependent methyltransferase [Acetobacteraceae bacterium]|jgi:2-polyprenyl-3-methyl-5-hydroxy-6-metoxy-1,4-benzoquinol methylase
MDEILQMERTMHVEDAYAKGMAASGDEHFDLTPELDLFQYRMIKPYVRTDVLDVGAGPGRIARLLMQDNLIYDKYVISEPSDHFFGQLCRRIEAPSSKIALTQGDTSDLVKQYARAFDTIFSVHVLEHVEDDRAFLGDKSMVRRLVQGLDCKLETIYYANFLAIFASLTAFKILRLDYQKSEVSKGRFVFLEKVYSRYFIPIIDLMERNIRFPVALNLTFMISHGDIS